MSPIYGRITTLRMLTSARRIRRMVAVRHYRRAMCIKAHRIALWAALEAEQVLTW